MAVMVLLRLSKLLGRGDFFAKAEAALRGYRDTMAEHPAASGQMLVALDFYLGPVQEIVVVGPEASVAADMIRRSFGPKRVLAGEGLGGPLLEGKAPVGGATTVYVCQNYACQAPLVGMAAIRDSFA
jgi:hypothetical protein